MPRIQQNERQAPTVNTFVASAFQLPSWIKGNVHFIGDFPYGRSSHVAGDGHIEHLVDSIAALYPTSTMTFIMTHEMAEGVVKETRRAIVETTPCRDGRTVVHIKPRFS